MLQTSSSVIVVYRRKTLTGSPDPTRATGRIKHVQSFLPRPHKPEGLKEILKLPKSPQPDVAVRKIKQTKTTRVNITN